MKRFISVLLALSLVACAREGRIAPAGSTDAGATADPKSAGPGGAPANEVVLAPATGLVDARPTGARIRMRHLRLSTPKEKVRWEKAVDALWRTSLGELYAEYLFSPTADHSDLPLWARMLANRVFREEMHLTVRTLALQIMTEDLYVREKANPDVALRVMILNGHVEQKDTLVSKASRGKSNLISAALITASSFYGFGAIRRPIARLGRRTFGRWVTRKSTVPTAESLYGKALAGPTAAPPARGFKSIITDYSFAHAATAVGFSVFPGQALDTALEAYYSSGVAPKDYEMLDGMDDLIMEMDAPDSLELPDEKAWAQFRRSSPMPKAIAPPPPPPPPVTAPTRTTDLPDVVGD